MIHLFGKDKHISQAIGIFMFEYIYTKKGGSYEINCRNKSSGARIHDR